MIFLKTPSNIETEEDDDNSYWDDTEEDHDSPEPDRKSRTYTYAPDKVDKLSKSRSENDSCSRQKSVDDMVIDDYFNNDIPPRSVNRVHSRIPEHNKRSQKKAHHHYHYNPQHYRGHTKSGKVPASFKQFKSGQYGY